jgi:hypothetical protein
MIRAKIFFLAQQTTLTKINFQGHPKKISTIKYSNQKFATLQFHCLNFLLFPSLASFAAAELR